MHDLAHSEKWCQTQKFKPKSTLLVIVNSGLSKKEKVTLLSPFLSPFNIVSHHISQCARILAGRYTDYSLERLKRICDKTELKAQLFPYFKDGSPCHL